MIPSLSRVLGTQSQDFFAQNLHAAECTIDEAPRSIASPPSPDRVPTFSVLSYNVWGIFTSKDIQTRMNALADAKLHHHDIVCLQENFSQDDYDVLLRGMNKNSVGAGEYKGKPTFRGIHDVSSFVGPGLSIITRFPILSHNFYRFPLQGTPELVFHGDYFAKKGVTVTRVEVAPNTTVLVYNTHFVAQYEKFSALPSYATETYAAVRLSQAAFFADVIATTASDTDNIILCGDFNCGPTSPEFAMLSTLIEDRRRQRQKSSSLSQNPNIFVKALPTDTVSNVTYSIENSYNNSSASYFQVMDMVEDLPVQLDHIVYKHMGLDNGAKRSHSGSSASGEGGVLRLIPYLCGVSDDKRRALLPDVRSLFIEKRPELNSRSIAEVVPQAVVMTFTSPEYNNGKPLSDHWGVAARFAIIFENTTQTEHSQEHSGEPPIGRQIDFHALPRPNQFFNKRSYLSVVSSVRTQRLAGASVAPSGETQGKEGDARGGGGEANKNDLLSPGSLLSSREESDNEMLEEMMRLAVEALERKKRKCPSSIPITATSHLAVAKDHKSKQEDDANDETELDLSFLKNSGGSPIKSLIFDAFLKNIAKEKSAPSAYTHEQNGAGDIFYFTIDRTNIVRMLVTILEDKAVQLTQSKSGCFATALRLIALPIITILWLLAGLPILSRFTNVFEGNVAGGHAQQQLLADASREAAPEGRAAANLQMVIQSTFFGVARVVNSGSFFGDFLVSARLAGLLVGVSTLCALGATICFLIGKLHREVDANVMENLIKKISLLYTEAAL